MNRAADLVFKSLADATRRSLFERLSVDRELTVARLTAQAGVSQPAVSKHLRMLKRAGLVRARRSGRETHYRARPEGLAPLTGWMKHYGVFWEERFDRLERVLDKL